MVKPASEKRIVPQPQVPLSKEERATVGTWVAIVDDRATKLPGKDALIISMDANTTPLAALAKAKPASSPCIWLEFYPDFSGFRYSCQVANGTPVPLTKVDPKSGAKTPWGARFSWSASVIGTPEMEFEEDLVLPASPDDHRPELKFRLWRLEFAGEEDGKLSMSEFFPETGHVSNFRYSWTVRNDFL